MRHLTIAAAALLLPIAASAASLSKTDQAFMKKAAIGGMTEVQEGQAAASTASSQDVKDFAQKMVEAHTVNNQALTTLAQSKGFALPTAIDAKHQKQMDMLGKKTGTAFDRAYVRAQTNDHEAMQKVMQHEIDDGTDPDVKAFATKTLTAVDEHLKMVEAIKS